jgi:hypothetical protein
MYVVKETATRFVCAWPSLKNMEEYGRTRLLRSASIALTGSTEDWTSFRFLSVVIRA